MAGLHIKICHLLGMFLISGYEFFISGLEQNGDVKIKYVRFI